ncbi:nose resistant to fluoxetine protein 6-like [Planococcus citri]|uniref:nose resistant to fluoxetine protein 6-like n=1 Tax=Planococcus citri TaxID=170843 RepID=UPI0031F9C5D2
MCKLVILFLFIFSHQYVYSQVENDFKNDTVEYVVNKLFENVSDSDVLNLFNTLNNYYNYTLENGTVNYDNSSIKSSTVMKINPPRTGRKYIEVTTPPPESSTKAANLEWISRPLREGLADLKVRSQTNQACNLQSQMYEMHLKNDTIWAIRMAESTQFEPIGILGGTTYQMGNFEECIKTKAFGVRGKYCLANFKYSLTPENERRYAEMVGQLVLKEDINQEASVWEGLIKFQKDPARIHRQDLYWGICLPATCSAEDLESSLNETLLHRFRQHDLELNITVDPIYCHTKDWLPFTTGFWITMTFMSLLLLANILSTALDGYDYFKDNYHHKVEGWREFVGTFSVWRNTYNLGIYSKNSQVKIVNGMKVIMMVLIIYGHTLLYILGYPQVNPASLEEVYRRGADVALVNTNIVDVFFTLSGFLTFYYGYHPMKVGGMVYLVLSVVFRYLRLMPVFAIVIAYVVFVLPYTSDGPIWNARVMLEAENCRKNWWLDILLLNNFYNVDEQCVVISWYITTDMLLCIIASVLIYIMIKKPKFGVLLAAFTLLLSIVVTFAVTYMNNYNGLLKLYMNLLINHRKSIEFKELYAALYSRAGPYLVGFLTGYITIKLQEKKYTFTNKTLFFGCALAIAIGEGSQYYGVLFYQFGRPYYAIENAFYACLHRILFAGLFSWFLLAYLTTGFGKLDSIINHRLFTVLGRITYSVFLMNTLSLITLAASVRTPIFYSYKTIMFFVFGDIVTTYVLGFLFYLYAEAPICGISKLMQKALAKMFAKEIEKAQAKVQENGVSETKKIDYGS